MCLCWSVDRKVEVDSAVYLTLPPDHGLKQTISAAVQSCMQLTLDVDGHDDPVWLIISKDWFQVACNLNI